MAKIPITTELDQKLDTQIVRLTTNPAEFGDDDTLIAQPLQITLTPGVYNLGYTATLVSRISGTAIDEWVRRFVVLRDGSNNYLEGSSSISYGMIEDDGANDMVATQSALIPEVVVETTTVFTMWAASQEDPDSGGTNTLTRVAGVSINIDGVDIANTFIWAQKVREVA